jgi:hypothetical protein
MAIMMGGRVVAQGSPASLVANISGRLWSKRVARNEIDTYRHAFNVISTRYIDGHTAIFVLSDSAPGPGFEPVGGDLQDVYFATIAGDEKVAA